MLKSYFRKYFKIVFALVAVMAILPPRAVSQTISDSALTVVRQEFSEQKKYPLKAALLSYLIPSSGHAYVGNWPRGLLFAAGRAAGLIIAFNPALLTGDHPRIDNTITVILVGYLGSVFLTVWEAFDSAAEAKEYNLDLMNRLLEKRAYSLGLDFRTHSLGLQASISF